MKNWTIIAFLAIMVVEGVLIVGVNGTNYWVGQHPFGTQISMADINREAEKQHIRRPALFDQKVFLFSYVGNGYINVNQQMSSGQNKNLQIVSSYTNSNSILWRSRTLETYTDTLVSFVTNVGKSPPEGASRERLVRENDKLVAKVANESEAAHFMLKRSPSVCSGSGINYNATNPLFVQLMLVEPVVGDPYHRALLSVEYGADGTEQIKFILAGRIPEECPSRPSPSVYPGTLFMLNYEPR